MRTRHRSLAFALLVTVGAIAASPAPPAQAAPAGTVVKVAGARITVKAATGAGANSIVVLATAGSVAIVDATAGIATAPGCQPIPNGVVCPYRKKVLVKTGDGDDSVLVIGSITADLRGGNGNDRLAGGAGNDKVAGDAGNDEIRGGAGDDYLRGGPGNDTLDGDEGADLLFGQAGSDHAEYRDHPHWPTVTLDGLANDGGPGEGDNVRTETWDVRGYDYAADDAVLARGSGSLKVADTWVATGDFDLETRTETNVQVVAYYDTDSMMRVAARRIGSANWVHTPPLATAYPKFWDDHRYLELAFDPDGYLHFAGNHHGYEVDPTEEIVVCCMPLHYFRTSVPVDDPADVLTLVRAGMLSPDPLNPVPQESVVTYPSFFSDGERFFFVYRNGHSTYAQWYVNQLDRATSTWFNPNGGQPFFDGWEGYIPPDYEDGLVFGHTTGQYPSFEWDGERFHIWGVEAWVHKSDCPAGNNAVDGRCGRTYWQTTDFDHFYDVTGAELATPITPGARTAATTVDRARLGGAWGHDTAVDETGHPMIVYGRFAETRIAPDGEREGLYQAFVARWNGAEWVRRQISDWTVWTRGNAANQPVVFLMRGPFANADGGSDWYVNGLVLNPPNTRGTGWLKFDPETLATEPMPQGWQPPTGNPCATGNTNTPKEPPRTDWVDEQTGTTLVPHALRSNRVFTGPRGDAGDFYYLSYHTVSRQPVAGDPAIIHPPSVELFVRRTTCTTGRARP